MKRTGVGLATAGLLLAVTAAPAAAQRQDIKLRGYFGFGGGGAIPMGNYADAAKFGFLVNAIGGFTTRGGIFGARADVMWAQNSLKSTAGGGNERLLGLNADVVLTPGHRPNNVHPYFLFGAGIYNANQSTQGISGSETKFAINTGFGVQVHTGNRLDLFFEGRFISIRATSAINFIPLTVGVRWGGI